MPKSKHSNKPVKHSASPIKYPTGPLKHSTKPLKRSDKEQKQTRQQIIWIAAIAVVVLLLVFAIVLIPKMQPQAAAVTPAPAGTNAAAAATPAPKGTKQFSAAPAMQIDKTKQYTATVKMAKGGEFTIQLFPDKAPIAVNNFVFLARQGFFDGTTFHRVIEGFMAQGGDPTGTGMGNPGYKFVNEDSDLTFDKPGVVAMANAGRDTNGSQFFITFVPYPSLNGNYTIFGQVTSGMDVVNGITRRDPQQNPSFTGDVMQSITITEQ